MVYDSTVGAINLLRPHNDLVHTTRGQLLCSRTCFQNRPLSATFKAVSRHLGLVGAGDVSAPLFYHRIADDGEPLRATMDRILAHMDVCHASDVDLGGSGCRGRVTGSPPA